MKIGNMTRAAYIGGAIFVACILPPAAWQRLVPVCCLGILVFTFLPGPLRYGPRLLSTYVHEIGHGFAAIMTRGRFVRFRVDEHGGGLAWSYGGHALIISAAGYLTPLLLGSLLVFLSVQNSDRWALIGCMMMAAILLSSVAYADTPLTRRVGLMTTVVACTGTWAGIEHPVVPAVLLNFVGIRLIIDGVVGLRHLRQLTATQPQIDTDAKHIENITRRRVPASVAVVLLAVLGWSILFIALTAIAVTI